MTTDKQKYWDGSSAGYSEIVIEELETEMHDLWLNLIKENMPSGDHLEVLDSGCGPGFFSIILTECGHRLHSIDFSEQMLEKAKQNAEKYVPNNNIEFRQMDVHNIDYPDNSFDLIVSRNITWTLQNPTQVYREWLRVLKPGGKVIIFDANWNKRYYDEGLRNLMELDFQKLREMGYEVHGDGHGEEEDEDWIYSLPLNHENRPVWDVKTFLSLGCNDVHVVTKLDERLMNEYYRTYYTHLPIFMICATK